MRTGASSFPLPATATGIASPGNDCNHYSSSPDSGNSYKALFLGSNPSVYQQISYYRNLGMPVRPVWQPAQQIDLSTLTDNYRAANGDVLTGTTTYNVTIPGGATVTINGISVTGGGGGSVPAPAFAEGGESVTTKFEKKAGEGNVWTITAFAEMSNASRGTDVTDGQIKVYSADTLEALESATTPAAGAIVKETKSAVKATVEVPAPSGKDSQFFKVKFGE